MAVSPARAATLAAFAFAAAGTALVLDHQRLDSATMDEPFHALAGAEYAMRGTYFANLEHPPAAKLLAGLCIARAGGRPPAFHKPFSMRTAEQPAHYLLTNAIPKDALLAAARRPFPILFALLVLTTFAAGLRWGGALAGGGAAALVAFEPNLVAHAGILHTDVPAALGFVGTVALSVAALEGRSQRRSFALWAAAGAVLGASLAAKFSCVFLVPIMLLLVLAHALLARRRGEPTARALGGPLAGLLLAGGVSAAVLLATYAAAMRSMDREEAAQAIRIFLSGPMRPASPATVEKVVALSGFFPPLGHYVAGLAGIAAQNAVGGGINYLRGTLSQEGFPSYFFVAFGVKSSVGFLLALAAAAAAAAIGRRGLSFGPGAFLLAVAVLFVSGIGSSYNIGLRHMLPAYPLLAVVASVILVRVLSARAAVAVLALTASVQLSETLLVHPHELSFFNAFVGGPAHGDRWLNDSNLDWGQDLTRLAIELRRRGWEKETTIAYFGGDSPPAECPLARLYDPASTPLTPGVYAVSSFLLCAGPELLALRGQRDLAVGYDRLRRTLRQRGEPLGRVGYSILLFRLPPEGVERAVNPK